MNKHKLKVDLLMVYYWIFNRKLYKAGKKFRKACKTPEVQETFKEAIDVIFKKVQEESNG